MKRKRAVAPGLGLSAFAVRRQALLDVESAQVTEGQDGGEEEQEERQSSAERSESGSNTDDPDLNRFAALSSVHASRTASVNEAQVKSSFTATTTWQGETLILGLAQGESVAVAGYVTFKVLQGSIVIFGASLSDADTPKTLAIPKSTSSPTMTAASREVLDQDYFSQRIVALVSFSAPSTRLLKAMEIYPLTRACFSSSSSSSNALAISLTSPDMTTSHTMSDTVQRLCAEIATCTVLVGAKGTGKSTMTKYILNHISTSHAHRNDEEASSEGAYYLDLDPGQPEFSVPGTLSAHFFPPGVTTFTTSAYAPATRQIKSHWIGETSPKTDPAHYLACTKDLIHAIHRDNGSVAMGRIIVNTPGWIKGTGLDLLQHTIAHLVQLYPDTQVLHLGTKESHLQLPARVHAIEARPSDAATTTTQSASDLRTINLISYFHRSGNDWLDAPLTTSSWTRRYRDLSFVIVREVVPVRDLVSAVNGTIVALVAMDVSVSRTIRVDHTKDGVGIMMTDGATMDPEVSQFLGLAIVHGFDLRRRTVSLITPVILADLASSLEQQQQELVICSGSIEVPLQIMTAGDCMEERPYLTDKPGFGIGWQSWHVRRNIGRRIRN